MNKESKVDLRLLSILALISVLMVPMLWAQTDFDNIRIGTGTVIRSEAAGIQLQDAVDAKTTNDWLRSNTVSAMIAAGGGGGGSFSGTLTNNAYGRQTLSPTSPIAWDCNLGSIAFLYPTNNNITFSAPSNMTNNYYTLIVVPQVAYCTSTWNSVFKHANASTNIVHTNAFSINIYSFISDTSNMMTFGLDVR